MEASVTEANEAGAVGAEDAAAEAVVSEAGGEAVPNKGDYLGRVRSDPEFAVETVRSRDKKVSELNDRLKRFEVLEPYVNAVGADGLIGFLETGNYVASNDVIRNIVEEYQRTGQVPMTRQESDGQQTDEDLFIDPDVKALKHELAEARAEIQRLNHGVNQRLAEAETRSFKVGIAENIESVMSEYGVNEAIREEISQAIRARVGAAEVKARAGDAAAHQLLKTIGGDGGAEALEYIAMPVIKKHLGVIAAAKETKRAAAAAEHDTGGPSNARTAGGGQEAEFAGTAGSLVRQALENLTKKAGRDPRNLWG